MKGDFSRRIFDAGQHYKGVLHQQGRVWLDSDWNDEVMARLLQVCRETADVIGPVGFTESSFQISPSFSVTGSVDDFQIAAGTAYIQGIACSLDSGTSYLTQPNLLDPPAIPLPTDGSSANMLVYLEVWQRFISYLQDPNIREVALNGPDTTGRIQTVAQIRTVVIPATVTDLNCPSAATLMPTPSDGTLTVLQTAPPPPDSLCSLPGTGTYTGLENLLYRVEVHQSGSILNPLTSPPAVGATFKWSRNNGSFAVGVTQIVSQDGLTLQLSSLGRDQATALTYGDIVEISDDASDLGPGAGFLTTLNSNPDPDTLNVTLAAPLPNSFQSPPAPGSGVADRHLILRRWDGTGNASSAFDPVNTPQMDLGDGIHIQFGGTTVTAGDYWQFEARTDGTVDALADASPAGIRRYYAPLAVVTWSVPVTSPPSSPPASPPSGPPSSPPSFDYSMTVLTDCRVVFPSLAQPGVHITGVSLPGAQGGASPLINDAQISLTDLLGGIAVTCDASVAPPTLSRAVCSVSVEVPTPLGSGVNVIANQAATPDLATFGYTSIVLQGTATVAGNVITWTPLYPDSLTLLPFNLIPGTDLGMLARLTINGNCVWAADNASTFLDGESYGFRRLFLPLEEPLLRERASRAARLSSGLLTATPVLNTGLLNATPVATQPVSVNTILGSPILKKPVLNNPIITDPVSIDPVLANPILTHPIITEPILPNPIVFSPPIIIGPPIFFDPITQLRLPSGDGRSGGTFETWFWLTPPPPVAFALQPVTSQLLRSSGIAELLQDMYITVSGGVPATAGAPVPTYNITVTLNRTITSPVTGQYDDAVLLIDNPSVLNISDFTSPPTLYGTDGSGVNYASGAAPNIFQGQPQGNNTVLFQNVPIDAPAPGTTRTLRISNLRVDLTQTPVTQPELIFLPPPETVTATITGLGSAPLGPVTVATAQRGLGGFQVSPTLAAGSPPVSPFTVFISNIEQNAPVPQSSPVTAFVEFTEESAGVFRSQAGESGYTNSALPGIGQATQGTRLRAILTGLPTGVGVFATMAEIVQAPLRVFSPAALTEIPGGLETISTGLENTSTGLGSFPVGGIGPILFQEPRAKLVVTDANGAGTGAATPVGTTDAGLQVANIPVVNGTATVVWEWTDDSLSVSPTSAVFGLVLSGTPNTNTGPVTVQADIVPISAPTFFQPIGGLAGELVSHAAVLSAAGAPVFATHPTLVANPVLATTVITPVVAPQPIAIHPVVTEPVTSIPVVSAPVINEPVLTNPVLTNPILTNPVLTNPVLTNPVLTNPVLTNPVITEPVVTSPITTGPIFTNPIGFLAATEVPRFNTDSIVVSPAFNIEAAVIP